MLMRALRSAAVRCGVPRAAAAVGGVGVPRVQGGGAARSPVAAAGEAFREGFRQYSSSRPLRFRATPGACATLVSETEYFELAEDTFLDLEEKLEILENHVDGFDMTYSDGVMTMDLQEHGIWVMNKQRPNKEIWWSSPLRYGGTVCVCVCVCAGGGGGG